MANIEGSIGERLNRIHFEKVRNGMFCRNLSEKNRAYIYFESSKIIDLKFSVALMHENASKFSHFAFSKLVRRGSFESLWRRKAGFKFFVFRDVFSFFDTEYHFPTECEQENAVERQLNIIENEIVDFLTSVKSDLKYYGVLISNTPPFPWIHSNAVGRYLELVYFKKHFSFAEGIDLDFFMKFTILDRYDLRFDSFAHFTSEVEGILSEFDRNVETSGTVRLQGQAPKPPLA